MDCIAAPFDERSVAHSSCLQSYPIASSPQRWAPFEEASKFPSLRQALVIAQGGDAKGAHRVRRAQALLGRKAPEVAGEVPCVEGISRPDRIHFDHGEGWLLQRSVLDEDQATVLAPLEILACRRALARTPRRRGPRVPGRRDRQGAANLSGEVLPR